MIMTITISKGGEAMTDDGLSDLRPLNHRYSVRKGTPSNDTKNG